MFYSIKPVPKPRQTKSDKWKKRDCVLQYRAFADECRLKKVWIPESGATITFYIEMPKSWSKKKRDFMLGRPHQQKPDIDNLSKSLLDAVHKEDSHIYDIRVAKYWAIEAGIRIDP